MIYGVKLDQTSHSAGSELDVHCLLRPVCPNTLNHYGNNFLNELTHFSQETPKRVIGKQCRPRSDAQLWMQHLIRVYTVQFALTTVISFKHGNNEN